MTQMMMAHELNAVFTIVTPVSYQIEELAALSAVTSYSDYTLLADQSLEKNELDSDEVYCELEGCLEV